MRRFLKRQQASSTRELETWTYCFRKGAIARGKRERFFHRSSLFRAHSYLFIYTHKRIPARMARWISFWSPSSYANTYYKIVPVCYRQLCSAAGVFSFCRVYSRRRALWYLWICYFPQTRVLRLLRKWSILDAQPAESPAKSRSISYRAAFARANSLTPPSAFPFSLPFLFFLLQIC